MSKSHFNDEFLVLLGPIISRFFASSNEEKNKPKQQRVHALVLSLCRCWSESGRGCFWEGNWFYKILGANANTFQER